MCKEPGCGWRLERQKTEWWGQCIRSNDVAVCRRDSGGNVSGAMMWLYVGETEDSMVDAMYRKPGCGWR